MALLAVTYCTDEDIAVRAGSDFTNLVPAMSTLAEASDGAFAVGDPWHLTSASVNFVTSGVTPGCVVHLQAPTATYKSGGELFAVGAVASGSLTLRRIGFASGKGKPPAPAAGLSSVKFAIPTLGPDIEEASYEINQRYNIDPASDLRSPAMATDLRELRQLTVYEVLEDQYAEMSRQADDDFANKARKTVRDMQDLRSRMVVRWGPVGMDDLPSTIFSRRVTR